MVPLVSATLGILVYCWLRAVPRQGCGLPGPLLRLQGQTQVLVPSRYSANVRQTSTLLCGASGMLDGGQCKGGRYSREWDWDSGEHFRKLPILTPQGPRKSH